jgi:hypothetical protein
MTTVLGTYFTKEQLEVDLKCNGYYCFFLHSHSNQANQLTFTVDDVSVGGYPSSHRMRHIGLVYRCDKKQYDKSLAWYLLAAMGNDSTAYNNIGALYDYGYGVPQNYLCALKWYLKSAEPCENENTLNNIGELFEKGYGVPLDKYKALEWYCHGEDKANVKRLKYQGYHRSAADKSKFNYIIDSLY